jgi:hypothetical protein
MQLMIMSLVLAAGSVIQPASKPPTTGGPAPAVVSVEDPLEFKSDTLVPSWATKAADRNAALAYLSADNNLPRTLGEALAEIDWDKVPTAPGGEIPEPFAKASKVFSEGCEQSVRTMLIASTRERCDFELEYEGGVSMLMPHLGRMRQLARTLRFDARQEFLAGRPGQAAERVAAMYRMAAHVSNDRILISSLVSNAIAALATEEARVLAASGTLQAKDAEVLRAAIGRVLTSDPFRGKEAMMTERDLLLNWLRLAMNRGEKSAEAVMGLLAGTDTPGLVQELRDLKGEALDREIARAQEGYDEVLAAWGTPDASAKFQVINSRVLKGEFGVVARVAMPSFEKAYINIEKQVKELGELDQKFAAISK